MDPKNPNVWYVASAFGGLWKTVNRGITFEEIFPVVDRATSTAFNLCCVVVDPKDSNVVWLGTGENASQRSAHFGTGLYKSTDAGKTWKLSGLDKSEHIGKIVDRPAQLEHRVRRRAGPAVLRGRRARHLQDDRRRRDVDARRITSTTTTGFTDIVFDPKNPGHHVCRHVSAPAARRPDDRRRSGRRRVQDDERRQGLDETDRRTAAR